MSATVIPEVSLSWTPSKRGYPIVAEVGLVTGPEEPLRSAEETIVVLAPRHTGSRAKALSDHGLVMVNGRNRVEPPRHRNRTIRIGKDRSLLGRE